MASAANGDVPGLTPQPEGIRGEAEMPAENVAQQTNIAASESIQGAQLPVGPSATSLPSAPVVDMSQAPGSEKSTGYGAAHSQEVVVVLAPQLVPGQQPMLSQPPVLHVNYPVSPDVNVMQENTWKAGLCDCFQSVFPNCCMAYFCPCITFSQINARTGLMAFSQSLFISVVVILLRYIGVAVNQGHLAGYPLIVLGHLGIFALIFYQRYHVRKLLSLPGDGLQDCLASFFCGCCALAQLATQTGSYRDSDCDFAAPPLGIVASRINGAAVSVCTLATGPCVVPVAVASMPKDVNVPQVPPSLEPQPKV